MSTPAQAPALGRIVHFVLPQPSKRPGEHRAAIMTSAFPGDDQNLLVFGDQEGDFNGHDEFNPVLRVWSSPYDETGKRPASWHWPERVEPVTLPGPAGNSAPAPAHPFPQATPAAEVSKPGTPAA